FDQEVDSYVIFQGSNIGVRASGCRKRAHDLLAGQILCVKNSPMTMSSLAAEIVLILPAVLDPGEVRAKANQLAYNLGSLPHVPLRGAALHRPCSRSIGFLYMAREEVVTPPYPGVPAWRIGGLGLGPPGFGKTLYSPGLPPPNRVHRP